MAALASSGLLVVKKRREKRRRALRSVQIQEKKQMESSGIKIHFFFVYHSLMVLHVSASLLLALIGSWQGSKALMGSSQTTLRVDNLLIRRRGQSSHCMQRWWMCCASLSDQVSICFSKDVMLNPFE